MNQTQPLDPEIVALQKPTQLWIDTFKAYKATLRPALCLTLGGIAIPLFVLDIYFDNLALKTVPIAGMAKSTLGLTTDSLFLSLLSRFIDFSSRYMVGFCLVLLLAIMAYFAIVSLASHFHNKGTSLGLAEGLKTGVSALVRKGVLAIVISFFIFVLVAQITQFFAIIALIAFSTIPILILNDHVSAWGSVKGSLGFSYARIGPRLHFAIVLRMLSLGVFLYALFGLSTFLAENFLQFDRNLPVSRALWLAGSAAEQPPTVYLVVNFLLILVLSLALHFYAVLTTTLLHHLRTVRTRVLKWV